MSIFGTGCPSVNVGGGERSGIAASELERSGEFRGMVEEEGRSQVR